MFGLDQEEEQRALDVHRKSIVIDAALIPKIGKGFCDRANIGGVTAVCSTVSEGSGLRHDDTFYQVVQVLSEYYNWRNQNPDKLLIVTNVSDIRKAKKSNKPAIIFSAQNSTFLEDNLDLLTVSLILGVRIIQLTYNYRNSVGDGCTERTDSGLSRLGVQLVEEMNAKGVLIDLSHCGHVTTREALDLSKDPVVFTHANSYTLCSNPRNKTDEEIQALAEKGGVMGVCAFSPIVAAIDNNSPSIVNVLDNIDYVVRLVGVDHIGLGSDIDEPYTRQQWLDFVAKFPEFKYPFEEVWVKGWNKITELPNVTRGLVARGYSDQEITKILGGNFLRVFDEVWR